MKVTISILFLCFTNILAWNEQDYWKERKEFIEEEKSSEVGSSIPLTDREQQVNEILMNMKLKQLNESFQDPGKFLPAHHFFVTRDDIQLNRLYMFLRAMPKGALLHTHEIAMANWGVLYRLTYTPGLYLCNQTGQPARLQFFDKPSDDCDWKLVKTLRETNSNFEAWLKQQMTLISDNEFGDMNKVWTKFQNLRIFLNGLLTYQPVFISHYLQTVEQLYEDGIMYFEFRGTLPGIYDLAGYVCTPEEVVGIYKSVTNRFKKTHPKFHGARVIYAPIKPVDNETVEDYKKIAENILKKHPDFVAGFDLVGVEDLGRPPNHLIHLVDYVKKLQGAKFYFHTGETNWHHASTDINILDAILLGTNRLGHAFALAKHPELMKIVKKKEIALEISPISNQVLLTLRDMRNHPAAMYLADGFPVVITNDYPAFWGAEGVSYDWYMMFLGISSRHADLKMLKQLAINSIKYSSLEGERREEAMQMWNAQWDEFIENYK